MDRSQSQSHSDSEGGAGRIESLVEGVIDNAAVSISDCRLDIEEDYADNSAVQVVQPAPVLEASRVYVIMKREYRISRNIRAKWYFDHINKVIDLPQVDSLDELTGELEVVSATPRDCHSLVAPPTRSQAPPPRYRVIGGSIATFLSWRYRLVFALDLGHSAAAVDIDTGLVFIDKAFQALKNTLVGLTQPFTIPGSKFVFTPELYVTVIAYTPIVCCQLHQVLIQGFTLTASNVGDFLDQIQHQLEEFENYISASLVDVDLSSDSDDEDDQYGIGYLFEDRPETPEKKVKTLTPDAGFVNMLRYSILALQLLPENTSAGIIVITDGIIGLPHMSVLDGLLAQLRSSTIACSFIYVGNNCQNNQGLGQVPYVELMQFMATATFGAYLSHAPVVDNRNEMNLYHKALLTWSFQKGLQVFKIDDINLVLCDDFREDHTWRHRSQVLPGGGQQICDTPLLRKRHADYTYNASLFSLLSVRLREGYTIKEVTLIKNESQIEVKLVLPWSHDVWIEYVATSAWPFATNKRSTHVQVYMAGTYEFLHDVTCQQNQFKSPYRTAVVSKFQSSVCGLSETDRLLVHLQSFLSSTQNFTIADDIREKMPLFYVPPQTQSLHHYTLPYLQQPAVHVKVQLTMRQSRRDTEFMSFANYWKPIMLLNVNIWQKWMHAHRLGLLLECDQPLPKYLHIPNNSGRFNSVQCRQALMVLNTYLKDYSTFVLMENHSYVKFLYGDPSEKEKERPLQSFFLIRVSSTPPCMVLRLAFMMGTPGYIRNEIMNEIRGDLCKLALQLRGGLKDDTKSTSRRSSQPSTDDCRQGSHKNTASRQWSGVSCCVLLTKPLEKMLIRYERKPRDFMTLEMDQLPSNPGYGNLGNNAPKDAFSMFTALTRYQHRQRWVWSVQNGSAMSISMAAVGRVLNTLAKIRLQEGYHFAHSSGGVVNLVAEMEMMIAQPSDGCTENTAVTDVHNCVVQYILFPPHVATQRQESLSEDDLLDDGALETTEADSELQIVSECWVEPQYGLVINSPDERRYLDGLRYPDIPLAMYPIDYECISSMVTFEHLALMCQNAHISCPPVRCSVPQQSVATPQNPDGCPEVTESAVQYIPYTFNIIGTLAKCQQAEMLFSTYLQEASGTKPQTPRDRAASVSSDHLSSPNSLLFDFLIDKLLETHDKEVYLSDLECGQFLSHVTGRPRKESAPVLPFKTPLDLSHNLEAETENQELEAEKTGFTPSRQVSSISEASQTSFLSHIRTNSTMSLSRMVLEKQPILVNDSVASPQSYIPEPDLDNPPAPDDIFPRWRCFVKQQTESRLTLTFIPASYADLETLMHNCEEAEEIEKPVEDSFDFKIRETLLKNVLEPLYLRRSKFWGSSSDDSDSEDEQTIAATVTTDVAQTTDDSVVFEGSSCVDATPSGTEKSVNATPSIDHNDRTESPDSVSTGLKNNVPKIELVSPGKPKVKKRTLLLPMYCYNASLDRITEELENLNHDNVTEEDRYHDFSFRSEKVRSHRTSMADILHVLGPETERERRDSQEEDQEWSLEQHCSHMFDNYYRCFMTGAYRSLQRGHDMSKRDFELALDIVCHELRPVEIDVTKFVETVCGHIRNHVDKANMEAAAKKDEFFLVLPKLVPESPSTEHVTSPTDSSTSQPRSPSLTTTLRLPLSVFSSPDSCLDVRALHSLIQRKFSSLVQRYFRPVPCAPEYMYFCPGLRQNSMMDESVNALNETAEADQSYDYFRYDDTGALTADDSDDDEAGFLNHSQYGSEHSMQDDAFMHQEDGHHPLFIQLFCSPALRSRTGILTSIPVATLPTCLHELPHFHDELSEHLGEIELGELQLTLDIICVTLPSEEPQKRERWTSGGTDFGGAPGSPRLAEDGAPESEQYDNLVSPREAGLEDGSRPLSELPKAQREAVTAMVDRIEWMLRDEIASALHLMQPVTRDMLEMVATHVLDSKDQPNCMSEDINLKFVYGTEPSTVKFVEEFEKMKLPGHHLSKEGDYYYLLLDRLHSPSFLHIESASTLMDHLSRLPSRSDVTKHHDVILPHTDVTKLHGVISPNTDDSNEKSDDVPGISVTRPSPAKEKLTPLNFSNSEGAFQVLDESSEKSAQRLRKLSAQSSQRRASVPNTEDQKNDELKLKTDEIRRASFHTDETIPLTLPSSDTQPQREVPPVLPKTKLAKLKLTSQSMEKVTMSPTSDSPRSRHSSGDEIRRILHGGHGAHVSVDVLTRRCTSSPIASPDKLKDISEIGQEISLKQSRSRHSSGPRRHHSGGSQASSINQSRSQTPRGGSHIDFSGRGSCTDQGYEGDSSDSEVEDRGMSLGASMNYNAMHQPMNFWIIMRLAADHVKMYFHTRPCDDGEASEFLQHKALFRQIVTKIQAACKIVNQMLLLESLNDTRMCNFLLVPEADEDVVWKDDHHYTPHPGKQESDEEEAYVPQAYQEFLPGHFACQCVWQHTFSLHPRLKTGPGRSVASRGIQALRGVMLEFSVNNRKNMFVVKETTGSVFYLRLYESLAELRTAGLDGGGLLESRSSSMLSLSTRRPSEYDEDMSKHAREAADDAVSISSRSASKRNEECLVLSVHGITLPGEEVKVKLTQMLQNKLDESVLDLISVMLARNPMCKLMAQDVQFIQRPDLPPKASHCYTIPSAALLHLMALRQYIRQNLLQFLHTPKYIDAAPDTHFQDYSQNPPVELSEHEVFVYNRPQSSGGKGIACIHVCFVDGRGHPVQLLSCPLPVYDQHQEPLEAAGFQTMTTSSLYEPAELDTSRPGPTALVRVRVWERGNVDIKSLIDKVHLALRHATCDVIMEYKLFTAPICSIPHQQHRMTETSILNLSAPSSPVKVPRVVPQSAGPAVFTASKESRRMSVFNWNVKPSFPPPQKKTSVEEGASKNWNQSLTEKLESLGGKTKSSESEGEFRKCKREEIWKQTIRRYECGEDGILSHVYSAALIDWFNFCLENGVPSMNRSTYTIQSRLSVEMVLKECQTVIGNLCDDTELKVFKKVAGKEHSSIYIPHSPCSHHQESPLSDDLRPIGPSTPGQVNLYICLARNVKQWRGCVDNPYLPEEYLAANNLVNTKTHKSTQRFLPYDSQSERSRESVTSQGAAERSRDSVTSQTPVPDRQPRDSVTSQTSGVTLLERERDHVYIPRQRLMVMYVEDKNLTVFTYNWSADLYASLDHSLERLVHWHNARYSAACSVVAQKMGLFQHCRFDELNNASASTEGPPNPFTKLPECIDLLVRHSTPAIREFKTRAAAVATRSMDHRRPSSGRNTLANFDDIFLYSRPHKPLHMTSLSSVPDPIKRTGLQAIEVHHTHCKECERQKLLDDLYRMWHQKAGRTAIPSDELELLLSQSELFHYMMAPILFCPRSRQFLLRPKQHTSNAEPPTGKEPKRSRHQSGAKDKSSDSKPRPQTTPVASPEPRPRVEESWPNTLIQQYVQYIQSWGFILVHTTAPSPSRRNLRSRVHSGAHQGHRDQTSGSRPRGSDPERTATRAYLQRTIPGGIILVQISLQEALFCVRLYAYHCEDRCIEVPDLMGSQFQTRRYFYDECEKYKDMIHVNSFVYDFHLRMIQSYIDGRQLVLKNNYHLTGFLRDFILMYQYPPNHARNYVYAGQMSATNQTTSAAELYDYMLKHDKRYEMKAIKMTPHVEKDDDLDSFYYLKEHEYSLVCLSHEALQEPVTSSEHRRVTSDHFPVTSAEQRRMSSEHFPGVTTSEQRRVTSDHFLQQKRDDYDVGLVLSQNKKESLTSVHEDKTLVLNYYIILTSKREPFPKLQLEKHLTTQKHLASGVFRARHPLHTMMAQDPMSFLQSSPPLYSHSPTNHSRSLSANQRHSHSPTNRSTLSLTNGERERARSSDPVVNQSSRSLSASQSRDELTNQEPRSLSANQSLDDLVNYLGFSSGHQLPLYTLMVRKVQSVRNKLDQMVTNAMSQCRRDLLWQRMLCSCSQEEDSRRKKRSDTDESRERLSQKLSHSEFSELLECVPRRALSSIDDRLVPLMNQKASWYAGLVGVLQAKYPDTSRVYTSQDGSQQFVVVLNPNYLDTFMLLACDTGKNASELCAVFRETMPVEDQSPSLIQNQLQSHMEGFVNACCYYMWCSLVLGEKG